MILCPLENTAVFTKDWIQARPRVTQLFGKNPQIYAQFGMEGHNGIDYGVPIGTPVYASFDGKVKVRKSVDGYGLHIKLRSSYRAREAVYGHLSEVCVKDGEDTHVGDLIGFTGNTGFSTGPHLHFGARRLIPQSGDVFKWQVADYDNGYYGYYDVMPYMITFKGTHNKHSLITKHNGKS